VLVWSDETVSTQMVNGTPIEVMKPTPGARQQVIPLERYQSEIDEGKRRAGNATLGEVPKHANKVDSPMELMVSEVREIIVDEPAEATVLLAGDAVKPYWTKMRDLSDGQGTPQKESSLFLLADEAGSAKVKVLYPGKEPLVIAVDVKEK
jgi:hypothetical protein